MGQVQVSLPKACKLPLRVPREHLGEEIYLDLHLQGRKARRNADLQYIRNPIV